MFAIIRNIFNDFRTIMFYQFVCWLYSPIIERKFKQNSNFTDVRAEAGEGYLKVYVSSDSKANLDKFIKDTIDSFPFFIKLSRVSVYTLMMLTSIQEGIREDDKKIVSLEEIEASVKHLQNTMGEVLSDLS